jgi:hypothetical protein
MQVIWEIAMFRFERCATVRNAADIPAAVQFASEVTAYVNKQHSLNMKFGVEIFGSPSVHWYFDGESLDKMTQVNASLLKDRDYLGMLDKVKGIWLNGSLKDTIVGLS